MVRAQVVLTPTESKKLISQAVCSLPEVKKALKKGIVALHPSSSTYFITEQLLGKRPPTDVWVCGTILEKGLCGDMMAGVLLGSTTMKGEEKPEEVTFTGHRKDFTFTWVFKDGSLEPPRPLKDIIAEMKSGDIYIKGVNAIDPSGNVGVLIGAGTAVHDEVGGTIGRVMSAAKQQGYQVIFPVGLEKLIPVPVEEAAREAKPRDFTYSMGHAAALLPARGRSITEVNAIQILTGATATPVAAGGLSGAEGSVVLVVKGEPEQVDKAVQAVEGVKGSRLPRVRERNCMNCLRQCSLVGKQKHWIVM